MIHYYEEKVEKYWMKCFELLKKYYSEFHTVPVRRDIYEGVHLGVWYLKLLKDYQNGELSDKKIEMIKSIGINFETRSERDMAINPNKYKKKPRKNIEETWQKNFEILKRYIQKFGCFPTEHTVYEDVQIAKWCYRQRELKKANKLSSDKLKKLNSINFPWNINEIRWYQMYDKLKKYVEEHGTPPKSPHTDSTETRKIFTWLTSQRNRFNSGAISEHELKLLAEMQVVFGKESNDEMWLRKYNEFIEFVKIHSRYPIKPRNSTNAEEESSLAAWVHKQRILNRRGTIIQERKEMLNKIGFIWDVSTELWEKKFQIFSRFFQEYGKVPKRKEMYEDANIGDWFTRQIMSYKKGKLSDEQIEKFNEIGVPLITYIKSLSTSEQS